MINIILYEPEKPANIGNIMRSCSSLGAKLIIIGPLSFAKDEKTLRRAAMDYINNLDLEYFDNYQDFTKVYGDKKIYYVTRYSDVAPDAFDYSDYIEDYYFMFGRESTGIPLEVLKGHLDTCIRLPMKPFARSLNLSNCVAIILYEASRQQHYYALATRDNLKDEHYLK